MISISDLLILSQVPSIGGNRLRALVSHFGDTETILRVHAKDVVAVEGFSKKLASHLVRFLRGPEFGNAKCYAERQLSRVNKLEASIISFWDKRYPEHLKKVYDPPPFIFVNGSLTDEDKYSIAIVGTRSPSDYGASLAERFSQEFARLGIVVVSGLARGIDTIVHSSTLKVAGRTIAVIGSGLDIWYPPENKALGERISRNGAIISEYEMGAKPDAANFPRRNRIISGISLGTLVVETDVNGGAMITANTALDQNRDVFAIPGIVGNKRSRGCHALIKDGRAKLVETVDDVLEELATKLKPLIADKHSAPKIPPPELSLFERSLYDCLSETPQHIDRIAESSGMSTADALVNLLSLEFKGLVKQLPGKSFMRMD